MVKISPFVLFFSSIVYAFPQQSIHAGNYSRHALPTGYKAEIAPTNSSNGFATTTYHPSSNATATTSLRYYEPTPSTHLNASEAYSGDPFGFHKPSSNHTNENPYEPKFNFHDYIGKDAKLKPAIDVRIDPSDHNNIKPRKSIKLPYISEKPANENTVVAADVAFDFDADTVVLEHFYDLVDDLSCNSKTGMMWLAFASKSALQQAIDHWPIEGGMNIIAPLSGPNCDIPNERGAYRATVLEINNNKKRMKLRYRQKEWKDIATNVEADFGQLEYSPQEEDLQARDVLLRKRGFFSGIKKAFKKVVGVVKDVVGGIKNVINKITDWSTIKWNPSVSFGVSVGPFGESDSPFGKALTLYDSTNGGWPKGLSWQQLNKQITAGVQTDLKGRDLSNLSTEDFFKITAEIELEKVRLSRRAEPEWFQAGAWCVNCFAKANLKLAGHLKYNVLGFHLKELWIEFSGDMEANIAFGLLLKSQNDLSQSKEIVRVPVGPGIVIPGIFSLGCTLPVSVGVTLHTDASFITLVGANFRWPDMGVTINIKGGHGESHGWEPIITWTKPDLDDLSVSASVEVSTTIAFEIGVTVLGGLFSENAGVSGTVGVGEKIIYNRPDLSACTGLNLITYIRVGVQAYVQRVKTWDLWSKVWNIADICLWEKKKATPTVAPLRLAATAALQSRVNTTVPLAQSSVGPTPPVNRAGRLVSTNIPVKSPQRAVPARGARGKSDMALVRPLNVKK